MSLHLLHLIKNFFNIFFFSNACAWISISFELISMVNTFIRTIKVAINILFGIEFGMPTAMHLRFQNSLYHSHEAWQIPFIYDLNRLEKSHRQSN